MNINTLIMNDSFIAPALAALAIGLYLAIYYYLKNAYSYWDKKGIKGPKPWPFVGNFLQLLLGDRMKLQNRWVREYGNVYGLYRGLKPILVVADAEILQQICVKDFDAFTNHDVSDFFNAYQKDFLFFQKDEHWKRARALMSPTFTSGKIKRMFRLLDACADDLVACFDEQLPPPAAAAAAAVANGNTDRKALINVKNTYNMFTMDAITTCCYGLKLERESGSNDLKSVASRNDFVRMAMKLFEQNLLRLAIGVLGPKPLLRSINYKFSESGKFNVLASAMRQLIVKRRGSSKKYDDYLQLLVDAKLDDKMELGDMDLEENHHAGLTHESLRADQERLVDDVRGGSGKSVLNDHEVISAAMFLLIVGLETTATTLTHCSYILAYHPELQERLYEEVKKIAEYKEDKSKTYFSYEALTSCRYLDAVISETLRFFTPVFQLDREAGKDYRIEKYNLDLPEGTVVTTAFYAIMNNPEYWTEPEKFDPERFMPGNKEKIVPGSYCPFGIGPRHCLGMRFSLTEGKLALAKTIIKYRFEPAPGAQFPPVLRGRVGIANLKDPVVNVIARD